MKHFRKAWTKTILILFFLVIVQNINGQYNWTKLPFPDSTFVHFIRHFNNFIFAGAETGLFVSIDKGNSWDIVLDEPDIVSIAFFKNQVYAGSFFNGVFRSTDLKSWEFISDSETNSNRSLLATENDLFASTSKDILKWNESDRNWIKATLDNQSHHNRVIQGIYQVADELYAIGTGYAYKSDVTGLEWDLIKGSYKYQSNESKELTEDRIVFTNGEEMLEIEDDSIIHFKDYIRRDSNTFVRDFIQFDDTLVYIAGNEILLPDGIFYDVCGVGLTTLTSYGNNLWVGSISNGIWTTDRLDIQEPGEPLETFKIFPNPSNGNVYISFEFDPAIDFIFSIVSIDGKRIYQEDLTANLTGSFNRKINIEIPGNYIGVLESGSKRISRHFVIY
jgi:hypothetical protein